MNFAYAPKDFILSLISQNSKFDNLLKTLWNQACDKGVFNYLLDDSVQLKKLNGKQSIILQYNNKRYALRRKPESVEEINMPFNGNKFNFNKVKEAEILFNIVKCTADKDRHSVIVNVSPFLCGHVVLVPSVESCFNQVMRPIGIRLSLEAILLSGNHNFCMAFNSLMSYASVNHLHIHGWYNDEPLAAATGPLTPLSRTHSLYELEHCPVHSFVCILDDLNQVEVVERRISAIMATCHSLEIPQNLFLARGAHPEDPERPCVRVVVWPRRQVTQCKTVNPFNIAVAELAGFTVISDRDVFDNITYEEWFAYASNCRLPDGEYLRLKTEVMRALNEMGESQIANS